YATGIVAGIAHGAAGEIGQLSGTVPDPKIAQAKQNYDQFIQRAIQVFSNQQRYGTAAVNQIKTMLPVPGAGTSQPQLAMETYSIRQFLVQQYNTYVTQASQPGVPAKERVELRAKASDMRTLLQIMGPPP